jgi:hypothetical protein
MNDRQNEKEEKKRKLKCNGTNQEKKKVHMMKQKKSFS